MNFLFLELPSLDLVWRRPGHEDRVCSVIRTNYPKPSLLQVAAIMRAAGAEVRAVDMKIRSQDTIVPYGEFAYEGGTMHASRRGLRFEDVQEDIEWADLLGLSINTTSWANIARDAIEFARRVNPRLKVVVGGTDAMFRPEFYLRAGADATVNGDGEICGPEIMQWMAGQKGLADINGIFHSRPDGSLGSTRLGRSSFATSPEPAYDLMESDAPLWTMNIEGWIPPEIRTPIGFLISTRGCGYSCDYCTTPLKSGTPQERTLVSVAREFDAYDRLGISTVNIWDENLTSLLKKGKQRHLFDFLDLMRKRGFAWEFSEGMVLRDLWDLEADRPNYELIHALFGHEVRDGRWVGCYGMYFPFEFLQVQDTPSLNRKLMTFDRELQLLEAVLNEGVRWFTYTCIYGRPEDGQPEMDLAVKRLNQVTHMVEAAGAEGLPTPFMYSVFAKTPLARSYPRELMKYSMEEYPELTQLNATPHGTHSYTPGELMDAFGELYARVLTPDQLRRWWNTGIYAWKKP